MCGLHWYVKAVEGGALGGASPPVDNMVWSEEVVPQWQWVVEVVYYVSYYCLCSRTILELTFLEFTNLYILRVHVILPYQRLLVFSSLDRSSPARTHCVLSQQLFSHPELIPPSHLKRSPIRGHARKGFSGTSGGPVSGTVLNWDEFGMNLESVSSTSGGVLGPWWDQGPVREQARYRFFLTLPPTLVPKPQQAVKKKLLGMSSGPFHWSPTDPGIFVVAVF